MDGFEYLHRFRLALLSSLSEQLDPWTKDHKVSSSSFRQLIQVQRIDEA